MQYQSLVNYNKYTLHAKWNNGDFEIITKDNDILRVPSYYLQSAS